MRRRVEINFKQIWKIIGKLLVFESLFILATTIVSAIYSEDDFIYFIITAGIGLFVGLGLNIIFKNPSDYIGKREGALIVTLTWVFFSFLGALPYWLSGAIPSFTDAFFESISGFTTTGASILNNIEELSHGILFWRSMTHWLGGLGIIVIFMALLPLMGINSTNLFVAETTGPTMDKISPKINDTAKILLLMYLFLTFLEIILLFLGGMTLFDAVCHSFATVATGGFSTKQTSIGYWTSPYIHYVISIFMLLAGVNFALFFLVYTRNFKKIRKNEELRAYLLIVVVSVVFIVLFTLDYKNITFASFEETFRSVLFTVASMATSTGFATVDYLQWKPIAWVVIIILMFIGASAGSTGGGAKVIRFLIVFKVMWYEFKKIIHPTAIIPTKYNKQNVSDSVIMTIFAFLLIYLLIVVFGTIILMATGMGLQESFGGVLSSISCMGPALGDLGPSGNYADVSIFGKWFFALIMLIGRLELFTVFIIFTPSFWKK